MGDEAKGYEQLIREIAPCGLSCGNCVAFEGGAVQQHAKALAGLLGPNFANYAVRFAQMGHEVFEDYAAFERVLTHLAEGSCTGCRGQGCIFTTCKVGNCAADHGVDFCFQCTEFPCDQHGMNGLLAERWLANNKTLKVLGVKAYYDKIKDRPRYP